MSRYIVTRTNITPTGGTDVITFVSGSSARLRLIEVSCAGLGTSAAAQLIHVERSSSGSVPASSIAASKVSGTDAFTMNSIAYSSWTTQPFIGTNPEPLGFNALAGVNRWQPLGGAFECRSTSEYISIRASSLVTWQAASISAIVEESYG